MAERGVSTVALPAGLRPTRLQIGLWAVMLAVMLPIVATNHGSLPAMGVDGSHYAVLAESLAKGEAYGLISRPLLPTGVFDRSSPFPWGYPLILAPLASLFPGQFDALRLPSLLATLVNACLLFWGWGLLGRRSYWWGLAVTGLYCLSPLTISMADRVFSEAVFTTFLLASTLLFEFSVRKSPGRLTAWWWPVTSAVLVMMVFTRTAGWAMLAGLGAYLLLRQRRAGLHTLVVLGAWMAVWTALVVLLTPVASRDLLPVRYAEQWQDIVSGDNRTESDQGLPYAQVLLNLTNRRLYRDIPSAIAPGLASEFATILLARWGLDRWLPWLGRGISLLLILGFLRWQRKEGGGAHTVGLSAFMLAAVPYLFVLFGWRALGPRLLYPVQPQLFYAFLLGCEALLLGLDASIDIFRRHETRQRATALASTGTACIAVALLAAYATISIVAPDDDNHSHALEERGRWFLTNTPPLAIVMSLQPEMDYLYSQRRGLPYPQDIASFSPDELAAYLQATAVDYLVVEKQTGAWRAGDDESPQRTYKTNQRLNHLSELAHTLQASGLLELRHTAEDDFFSVYAVLPPASP